MQPSHDEQPLHEAWFSPVNEDHRCKDEAHLASTNVFGLVTRQLSRKDPEYFSEGNLVKVKIIGIERGGKIKLTMKGLRNNIPKIKNEGGDSGGAKKPRFF